MLTRSGSGAAAVVRNNISLEFTPGLSEPARIDRGSYSQLSNGGGCGYGGTSRCRSGLRSIEEPPPRVAQTASAVSTRPLVSGNNKAVQTSTPYAMTANKPIDCPRGSVALSIPTNSGFNAPIPRPKL